MTKKRSQKGARKAPVRTCAVCRSSDEPTELIRWVRGEDGTVVPDLAGRSFGRGAWVHPRPNCLKKLQPSLARSFKAPVTTTTEEALLLLRQAAEHRAWQLIGAARRQNLAVFGTDATKEAWFQGKIALLLVAKDARAAAESGFVAEAVSEGAVSVWGSKDELGRVFGRAEIGVVGVIDNGLAKRLFGAIAMALLVQEPASRGARRDENARHPDQEIDVSSEVE